MNPAELMEIAEGDAEVAGWIAGQLLAGHELSEVRVTMQTALTNLQRLSQHEDGAATLRAFNVCMGMRNFPMPMWLRQRLSAAIGSRLEWNSTLDEALDLPAFEHKATIERERDFARWMSYAWQKVGERSAAGEPIDVRMYGAIAEEICVMEKALTGARPRIGATKVGEMYAKALEVFGTHQ